jgi:hypothetical protein
MDFAQLLQDYTERTGQTEKEIFAGLSSFELTKIEQLIIEANRLNKKLVFYYENDGARLLRVLC